MRSRRGDSLATLYAKLFELAALRAAVAELPATDAERFLVRLNLVERTALSLLCAAEKRANVVAH